MYLVMLSNGFWNRKHELNYVFRLAFSAGLGGFVYGYCLGVINSFLPCNENEFEQKTRWMVAHGMGSMIALWPVVLLTRTRGTVVPRDLATMPACPLLIVGAFLIVRVFPHYLGHAIGSFVIGVAPGLISMGSTIYLAEISPTRIRGAIVATFFFQIAAGQIVYYVISLAAIHFDYSSIDDDKKHLEKWHWVLGIIPVLFIFKLKNWLPKYSPNCLYALGKKEEAIEILRKTRPSIDDVVREVEALKLAVKNVDEKNLPYWSEKMIAGIACLVAEHLVGMNIVMYYTPRILVHVLQLDQYPASSKYLMLATLLTKSVLSAIGTLLCIAFVDRYGRRRLLLLGTFGIITCLGFLSFVLYGHTMEIVIASSCAITGNGGMGNNILGLLALGALGLYFIFYSMGIGTIPWIINTEIYPLGVRISFGMTASITYWFIKVYLIAFYRYLDDVIGQYNIGKLFLILCLFSCTACCIVYVYALETKGFPIEEVEKLLLLEKKISYDLKRRQVILTSREEIPYMFSSSSSDDE